MFPLHQVWVFTGLTGHFPGGVFTDVSLAEAWIAKHSLTGVITAYPVDQGCFDWAIENGCTNLSPEKLAIKRIDPAFIGSFSSASQEHFHYESGKRV